MSPFAPHTSYPCIQVEIPASKYVTVAADHCEKESHCQIEAHVHWKDLISHAPDGDWAKMAPFRILSTDIECAGRKVKPFGPHLHHCKMTVTVVPDVQPSDPYVDHANFD